MQSSTNERQRDQVETALANIATRVESNAADAAWIVRLGGPKRGIDVTARLEDDLLLVDAPLPSQLAASQSSASQSSDWNHLEATGRFAGGVKLARVAGRNPLRLRAELSLAARSQPLAALRALREGLLQAQTHCRTGALPPRILPADPADGEFSTAGLDRLCEEAGWDFEPRRVGGVAELEVGSRFEQASLTPLANGSLLLRVELAACKGGQESSASAQAHCLMRAASFFRLVRPAAERDEDGQWQPRYEVSLTAGTSATEIAEALAALSVACLYSAEELRVLATNAGLADRYLHHQHRQPHRAAPAGDRAEAQHAALKGLEPPASLAAGANSRRGTTHA